jgi:carbon starvation protein
MIYFPMFFMLAVTSVSLIILIVNNIRTFGHAKVTVFGQTMQIVFAVLLIALAIVVAMQCFRKLFGKGNNVATATAD